MGTKSQGYIFTSLQVNTDITLTILCFYHCLQTSHSTSSTSPSFSYRQPDRILSTYLTSKSNSAVAINLCPNPLLLLTMKLTSTVNLVCHFSLALAAKAMNSNLLPGYQHGYLHHGNASIFSSPTNISVNASLLLAPFCRNVAAGGAWVLPASPFDLEARAMTCECFDPDGTYFVLLPFSDLMWPRMPPLPI